MKSYSIILLFLLSLFVFSCKDNLTDIGSGTQSSSDQINIGTDTFHLISRDSIVDFITSKPDSFLLGNYYDTKFGSTNAEILAQVNCPVGFQFPPLSVPDSASIVLLYSTWFGNQYSPLDVNIYQLNKSTFDYSSIYPTNLDPSVYTDQSIKLSERIFTAKDADKLRGDTTAIVFQLPNSFVQNLFNKYKNTGLPSTSDFLKYFQGVYIKASYGSATLMNIGEVNLRYYYHYTYTTKNIHGSDSTVTVNNNLYFPANSEVRQVNRIIHSDRNTVVGPPDSLNYISSPANLYTRISIPLKKIQNKMNAGIANKKLTINSANLKVEAVEIATDTLTAPTTSSLLLVKSTALQRFFNNNELPSDTCSVLASHTVALVVGTTDVYEDYYSYSITKLIANELAIAKQNNTTPSENLNLVLVPVQVTYNTSSVITKVKQSNIMSAVTIRSGKNVPNPMHLSVVYSGF
jgi:hypothetical protein